MPSDQRQAMRNLSGTQQQQQQQQHHHPVEPENLPCPRCDSTNTKFCYYNNYNLSQPRYFCKSCRRYWTRGGTLRNVPVGGGSRKNSKRSRSSTSSSSSSTSAIVPVVPPQQQPPENDAMMIKAEANLNLNEASFTSLLTANPAALLNGGGGLGYGLGLGFGQSGYEDMGLGFGYGGPSNDTGSCWQVDGGMEGTTNTTANANDGGGINVNVMDGGDYFGWPELAISTASGKGME